MASNLPYDHKLIEAIRGDDADAFVQLIDSHSPRLLRLASAIVGSSDIANDVVQDVFMNLWTKRKELEIPGDIKGYLWAATRNRARSVLRHDEVRKRHTESTIVNSITAPAVTFNTAPALLEAEDVVKEVYGVLLTLPDRCREIFLLYWRDQMTVDEIADGLEIAVPTVRNQIGRAVRRLAEHFDLKRK